MAKELGLKSKRGAGGAALVANPPRPPREYEVVHDGERVTMKLGTRHEIERAVLPPEQWSRVEESRSGPVVSHRNVRQALQGMAYKLGEFASRGNIADHWIGLSEVQKTLSNMIVETAAAPDSAETAARVAQLNALVEGTRRGNQQCRLELAALRTFTIELYVRGTSQFLQYFRTVPLAPNEQPNYLTSYMQETSVRYIAEDGYTTARMIAKAQKVAQFAMRALHTDDVLYPIRDLTLGTDVQESAKATVDLGFDMANQVDLLAYGLVTGSLGSFTAGVAGGAAALAATYIPNSRIQQALLPQTNILPTITGVVSPAANTPGWFQIPAAIIAYCDAWGNIFRDGPLVPTGMILIPASQTTLLSKAVIPTAPKPTGVAEGALNQYMQINYLGRTWTLVPDVTIPQGVCYPFFNKFLGDFFVKPNFDQEFIETNERKNWEKRSIMKAIQFVVPEPQRVNVLQVPYS